MIQHLRSVLFVMPLVFAASSSAAILVQYDNDNSDGGTKADPVNVDPGLTATVLTEVGDTNNGGAGFTFNGTSLFINDNPLQTTVAAADDGIAFTLTAVAPGGLIDLENYIINLGNVDGGGNASWGFKILVDGVEVDSQALTTGSDLSAGEFTLDLTGVAPKSSFDIQVLFADTNTNDAAGLNFRINEQEINGEVLIPEPGSLGLIGLGGLIALYRRR